MRILFLSPHTDDVELGAGGTLIKFLEEKHDVLWIAFSSAEDSLPDNMPKDILKTEFTSVVKAIKLTEEQYRILNYKVRYLPHHRQDVLDELIRIRRDFKPDLVVGPSLNDHHQDHETVAKEMIRAYKDNASIISYELPWNHLEFNTQMFVKIEDRHIMKKFELVQKYDSQIDLKRQYLSKDFIYGWARMRGVQVKADYAEAFEVIRWIL